MAHGHLIASFLSPLMNHRDDEYGGDFERRLAFPIEVLDAVRAALGPDRILGIRLGCDDLTEGGLRPADAARIAAALESRVDYISVMVGNNNRLEPRVRHWPPTPARPAIFRDVVRTVKEAVTTVPVAGVGRILTLDQAEDMLRAGDADMAGMVRAQIADPELLPLSRAGRAEEVRPCIGSNVCVHLLLESKPIACLVNPDVADADAIERAPRLDGTRAVVVGGGPAGLESARRLALRGAAVTLLEAADCLGGRMAAWSKAPSRREFLEYIRWHDRQLRALGVDLRLGATADAATVAALDPDLVVVATGAAAEPTPLRGVDGSVTVVTADRAFDGSVSGKVVVFDAVGNLDGALVAEHLWDEGMDVTLVTSRIHVGEGEGITTLFPMLRRLSEAGIPMVERMRPVGAESGEVVLEGVFGAPPLRIRADYLVTWAGGAPDTTLTEELKRAGHSVIVAGDALRPRRVPTPRPMQRNAQTPSFPR